MRTQAIQVTKEGIRYDITVPFRRETCFRLLENYIEDPRFASPIDFQASSRGCRPVSKIGIGKDRYVVKNTPKAETEFNITLKAEEVTDLTPEAGGVISSKDKEISSVMVRFFDALPIALLSASSMNEKDKKRTANGALFALGKIHYGDGKKSLLHRDTHLGNILIIPNPTQEEIKTSSEVRAEARIIDLEKSLITPFQTKILEPMAFDLLLSIAALIRSGYINTHNISSTIDSYLEGVCRLSKPQVKGLLQSAIPKHQKLSRMAGTDLSNFVSEI